MIKSRAESSRKRRENRKTFSVLIDTERFSELNDKLKKENKTKVKWLIEKIDEYLK